MAVNQFHESTKTKNTFDFPNPCACESLEQQECEYGSSVPTFIVAACYPVPQCEPLVHL